MSYSVKTTGFGKDLVIRLENHATGSVAEIFALGAILNRYGIVHNGSLFNCVVAYSDTRDAGAHIPPGFHGAKLSPFVCRLTDGTFAFAGKTYHTGKYFDGKSAIHGLVFDSVFGLVSQETTENSAGIVLSLKVDATDKGFPFPYQLDVAYTLDANDAVRIETTVTNLGATPMPVNDGWHPYFKLDDTVDDTLLQFRSDKMAVFDDRLLPTGDFVDYTEFKDFRQIGDTFLDNSFTLEPASTPALQMKSDRNKLLLSIQPEESYPILQIYTPPSHDCIAVENLTGLPDSFNNHIGLLTLAPAQSQTFVTTYHLQSLL